MFVAGDAPTLHPGRCLNRRHAGAACTRCVDACPVAAISLAANAPQLDGDACVRCGVCLPICPTDSFVPVLDYERKLCETVANLPPTPTALVCAAHPAPAQTMAPVEAVVQHRRCLAALAPTDLLELSAGGRRPLWLDDSPCAMCAIGAAQSTLHQAVDAARMLLHATGRPPVLLLHSERPPAETARPRRLPLYDGAQPAISRRALLARLRPAQADDDAAARVEDQLQRGAPVSARLPQQVPASRRRLLEVFATQQLTTSSFAPAGATPFAMIEVDGERCSACGLCARFCPSGALHFTTQADAFTLSLQPAACIDCGICVAACPENAVSLGETVALAAILADDVMPLATGALLRCTSCGAMTALSTGETPPRCHVCRQGVGVVTSLKDEAGLMADLLKRTRREGE